MIIDQLVVEDFGVYAGTQTIDLTPPSKSQPIVLIGGLNGGGKTTFLDAIQLCLHGKFANCSNRGDLAYNEFLRRSIHRNSGSAGARIELAFHHLADGVDDRFRVVRSWHENGQGIAEKFEVFKNGEEDSFLADNWAQIIEMILPRRIADLFLFDGEKIEALASPENAAELLSTATQTLLGMDIVGQLTRDLDSLKQRKNRSVGNDAENKELRAAQEEFEKIQQELRDQHQKLASLSTHKAAQARKRLEAIEYEFKQKGGETYERQHEIEQALRSAESNQHAVEDELRTLAIGDAPLLLLRNHLSAMRDQALAESKARVNKQFLKEAQQRDQQVIDLLKKLSDRTSVVKAIEQFLDTDLAERGESTHTPTVLDFSADTLRSLGQLLDHGLDNVRVVVTSKVEELDAAIAVRQAREAEKASIPAADAIRDLINARDDAKHALQEIEEEEKALSRDLDRLRTLRVRAKQRLASLLEKKVRADFEKRDDNRILVHASKVQLTLNEFRKRAIAQHIGRIESLISESFQALLRKNSLVGGVKIDPETFRMTLIDPTGREMPPERLSAGERQLLAVATVWGLARASNRQLPTVVDTPLGRLDSKHRANLVTRYFPHAGEQVILLSTDEEIIGEYFDMLHDSVGRTYELAFDEETRSTRIRPGYFMNGKQHAN